MHPKIAELYHRHGYGFLTTADLPELVAVERLRLCLVRCGNGRFIAPAQDVAHFVDIITREDSDHIRDVSLWFAEGETAPPKPAPPQRIPPPFDGGPAYGHSDADPGL